MTIPFALLTLDTQNTAGCSLAPLMYDELIAGCDSVG